MQSACVAVRLFVFGAYERLIAETYRGSIHIGVFFIKKLA
jgi:hypothetical protein